MAVTRLDDIPNDLLSSTSCIMANESNMLYQFSIHADHNLLLEGRAAVVFNADALAINFAQSI